MPESVERMEEKPLYETPLKNHENFESPLPGLGKFALTTIAIGLIGWGGVKGGYALKSYADARAIEEAKRDELRLMANYIFPKGKESRYYGLENGGHVVVYREEIFLDNDLLIMDFNDNTRLKSSYGGDLEILANLYIKNGNGWEAFDIRDKNWQDKYEELIREVYKTRKAFEDNVRQKIDSTLSTPPKSLTEYNGPASNPAQYSETTISAVPQISSKSVQTTPEINKSSDSDNLSDLTARLIRISNDLPRPKPIEKESSKVETSKIIISLPEESQVNYEKLGKSLSESYLRRIRPQQK